MNRELELKLQSYLDGELSDREARRVESWMETNSEAKALLSELKMTKGFLAGNEPEMALPESREFFWSKIEREISREAPQSTYSGWKILLSWRKYLAPIAGMALVVFLTVSAVMHNLNGNMLHLAEVENLSEDTGSLSFRSHSDNMFVVWVYDKPQSSDMESEPVNEDDLTVQ